MWQTGALSGRRAEVSLKDYILVPRVTDVQNAQLEYQLGDVPHWAYFSGVE